MERQEVQLLTWGIIDGGFSEDEIKELADDFLNNCEIDEDVWDFIEQIIDRKLLFEFNLRGDRLFRTRMAEGVRLFARLRQLFPNNSWQTSPTLVADYRLQIRPRIYPKRYITPETVIEQLEADKLLTPIRKKAVAAILNSPLRGEVQLADFQLRATSRMLRDLNSTKSRGMIVCAGTGTGKTLSFYLPALAHIAGLLKKNEYWSKGLAIYPRNELLKDQFSETYQEARRLDAVLKAEGKRKILIGAFFGLTPRSATLDRVQDKWESESGGFTCPYLRCPRCEGALSWRRADVEAGKEQLSCLNLSCGAVIQEDEVILTRDRMTKTPPDLVFTSTEMLNRSMGDSRYGHIFGIATAKKPQIVLLDEVHTYTGVHGAQVAYLLRRWQKIIATKVQFTGLSATLESAAEFFSQLIGLNPGSIEEVSPGENQVAEGTEYQLVLRGDPVSGTSLLSTTILTSMLLRRILDPSEDPPSQGFYGSRVFAFTDDLDVTNRLFHNLLDAEGCDSWGRPLRGRQPFAALRSHSASEGSERLVAGQSWLLCEEIGHGLELPLSIGRTSSQDTGVTPNSDVIVATASADVRLAEGHGELKQASDRLRKVLSSKGILVTHPVMTAINARVLRPGSTSETDKLLLDLIRLWHQEEARLGIEIDARVFAYVASNDDQLDQALLHLGLVQPNPYWRFQVIYGLLWARGNIIRSRALSSYNPFAVVADADREILLDILQVGDRTVWLNEPNWREQVEEAFKQGASVSLIAPPDARGDLKSAILSLAVEPMELGFLQVYPLVEGVQRYPGGFGVRLRVRETVQ
nr:protein DpdJ [Nostoc sp. FACHB-892]